MGFTAQKYRTRVHDDPQGIDRLQWNALLDRQARPTPFMRHEYLAALHDAGCATPATGWTPHWLTLHRGEQLVAGCAAYLKTHSWGEYVFDWAWADAYRRHGLAYYPKLVVGVPFTPVPGSRLLAVDDAARRELARALRHSAEALGVSSLHLLFIDDADRETLSDPGWSIREGVQFHWSQDRARPIRDFDDLLSRMRHDKRKKIRQERRRVAEQGIEFAVKEAHGITGRDWDFLFRCYANTYATHRSSPYLSRAFFARIARTMPEHWLLFVAQRDGRPLAGSLLAIDRQQRRAWGRSWGCTEAVPGLHFDACYYRPLEWCLQQGFERFEGGAQGEHKISRGLLPAGTFSAHWIADARFADAVDDFVRREGAGVSRYIDELREHTPFKDGAGPVP